MPGRVNTKFVLILVTTITAMVVLLGGFYYFQIRRNPDQAVRKGDVYMREGLYEQAIDSYARATRLGQEDPAYCDKLLDALRTVPVEFQSTAQRYLGMTIAATRQKTEIAAGDTQVLAEYYQLLSDLADRLNYTGLYNQLYNETDIKLDTQPDLTIARKYRGIARVHLLSDQGDEFDLPRADQLEAESDLNFVLDRQPDDTEALYHLALWKLFDARFTRHTNGPLEDIQRRRTEAISLSQRMLEIAPEDTEVMLRHARVCLITAADAQQDPEPDRDRIDQLQAQAHELIGQVESRLLADPQPVRQVVATALLLQQIDRELITDPDTQVQTTRGRHRAMQLLAAGLEQEPDAIDYLVQHGILLMGLNRQEEAMAMFEKARRPGRALPAIELLRVQNQQLLATIQLGNLLINEMVHNPDSDDEKLAARIMTLIREVETDHGRRPALDLLEGKLRVVQNRIAEGQQLLNKYNRATGEADADAVRILARVNQRRGEWGEAARLFEILLNRQPEDLESRKALAEIYLNGGQHEQARQHIDVLMAVASNDPVVQMLHASLLASTGELDQAIAIYEAQDPASNPAVDATLTRLYLTAGRRDDAQRLIARRFERNPQDLQALQALIRLTDDAEQRQGYLQQAREAGADEALLSLLERQMAGEQISTQELGDLLSQIEDDPFELAVIQARRLVMMGQLEDAEKELAAARALKPDDPSLIEMSFRLAIQREDWDQAERFATRAGSMNLDLAEGAFFRGQLAAARGHAEQAVAEFRQGLDQRTVYSDGWRMLGDAQAQLGRLHEAAEAYRQSLRQKPNNVQTLSRLSAVESQLQLFSDALRHTRDAWRTQPNNRQLLERYLELEQSHGDAATALRIRRELAEAQPAYSDNIRRLALLLGQQNQHQEASRVIDELIEREGLTRDNASTRAVVLRQAGDAAAGERVLLDYLASRGSEADSADHERLGRYRLAVGDVEGAIEAFNAARRLDQTENLLYTRMLGDLLFGMNLYERAEPLYREALAAAPDDMTVKLRLGETLIRMARYEEAEQMLSGVEPADATSRSTLYVLRSILAVQPGEVNQADTEARTDALRWVNRALQADANNPTAYARRAALLFGDEQRESAVFADLNRALELNPGLVEARALLIDLYLRQSNVPDAMRELRQLLAQRPEDRSTRTMLVNLYLYTGDRLSAQRLVDEAITLQPANPYWVDMRANLARQAGDTPEQLRQLQRLVELSPTATPIARYTLALIGAGQADLALSVLREHAAAVNESLLLQSVRARALAASGQTDQADQLFVNTLGRATGISAFNAVVGSMKATYDAAKVMQLLDRVEGVREPAWLDLARADLLIAARQYNEAIGLLEPMRSRLPSDPATQTVHLRQLAVAYHSAGRPADARRAYDELLTITPDNPETLNNLAYLLIEELNEVEAGLEMAERAAARLPDNAAVLDTLGWAQYKAGQLDEARQTLETSITKEPLAVTCLHLAQVYRDLGLDSRARDLLNRGLELADESLDSALRDQAERMLESLSSSVP